MKRVAALFAFLVIILVGEINAQSLENTILPAKKGDGFKMEGYILWCPSVIKVGDTYHLFASRWPEKYGLAGWTTYSEIVRATSKNLLGPYTFQEVVIQKREGFWDNDRAHNPKIVKSGDTFILYYISSANETGYATAKSIEGPWIRSNKTAMPFSNPAPLVMPDGSIYVFGRKSVNNIRIAQAYKAVRYDAAYVKVSEKYNLLPDSNQLEDPTIWWEKNQYNVIVSDFGGEATGEKKDGAQYFSKDGVNYSLLTKKSIYNKTVKYTDGTSFTFRRRERPFVYADKEGQKPQAFFTACLTEDGRSWIVAQEIRKK